MTPGNTRYTLNNPAEWYSQGINQLLNKLQQYLNGSRERRNCQSLVILLALALSHQCLLHFFKHILQMKTAYGNKTAYSLPTDLKYSFSIVTKFTWEYLWEYLLCTQMSLIPSASFNWASLPPCFSMVLNFFFFEVTGWSCVTQAWGKIFFSSGSKFVYKISPNHLLSVNQEFLLP